MNQSIIKLLKYLFYSLLLIFALYLGINYRNLANQKHYVVNVSNKLEEVLYHINTKYVDTVNNNQLMERAITSMLESLDPHSTYSTAEENKKQQEVLDGAFEGIGIQFNIINDTIMVINTTSGGPSEKAGIRTGDRIIEVNSEKVAKVGITNEEVLKKLRGKKGTTVQISILRPGISTLLPYTITRDVIETHSVDIAYMIQPKTGYIKINQFGGTTVSEFETALENLIQKGMKKLILDLQGNSGGYLEAALQICDHFLKRGELILYTEGEHTETEKFHATSKGLFEDGELIILIDEFSASASEIVAGAVQDNDRGTVVGRRSFGKGLVQRLITLSDGSTLRLTIARYHTPSGRSIQRSYKKGVEAYYDDFIKRYGENSSLEEKTPQDEEELLQYKTKKGRTVYGGGGILPDIVVPLDTTTFSESFKALLNSSLLIEFCLNYSTDNHQVLKSRYRSAIHFVKNMRIDDSMIQDYINFYQNKNNKKDIIINNKEKEELRHWLKALIGRNLYQNEAFYPILNEKDPIVQRALKVK
mgnify:FL=1